MLRHAKKIVDGRIQYFEVLDDTTVLHPTFSGEGSLTLVKTTALSFNNLSVGQQLHYQFVLPSSLSCASCCQKFHPTMPRIRGTRRILFFIVVIFHHALLIESLPRWMSLPFRLKIPRILGRELTRPHRILLSWLVPPDARIHGKNFCPRPSVSWLLCRGGSDGDNEMSTNDLPADDNVPSDKNREFSSQSVPQKPAHTSDVIRELDQGSLSSSFNEDSLALRDLVTSRTEDYLQELQEALEANDKKKLPHPRKLLHYLAPKVPAIRQSPDVNLRIHSSRSDIDAGIAACIISNLARACEMYDKEMLHQAVASQPKNPGGDKSMIQEKEEKPKSVALEITTDRRFEQLVECVISGVNVQKRKAEYLQRQLDKSSDEAADIEEVLEEEHSRVDEGLNIRDSCRAAWGMSVLGAHHLDTMGGVKVKDVLLALSLRIRELLLARLQLLRQDDLINDDEGHEAPTITTEERLNEVSEELAKDAATAMWAFACVRACTGMRSPPLFEACCSLLCQDPVDLRRRAQEAANYEPGNPSIGSSDVIDRLARSEGSEQAEEEQAEQVDKEKVACGLEKDVLLSWLSPTEVNDVLWALAIHGSNTTVLEDEITLSDTAASLRETAYDRMLEWLETDLRRLERILSPPSIKSAPAASLEISNETPVTLEVVDAAALLASQENPVSSKLRTETRGVPVENLTVHANTLVRSDGSIQEVEVVDAATLLASENSQVEIEVETELMVAPMSVMNSNTIISAEANEVRESIQNEYEQPKEKPLFSPHDLVSIAWSVTELRDPLKKHIVRMVIEIFAKLGYDGLFLSGADLSNLAWAIAKYEDKSHNLDRFIIVQRIAQHASQILETHDILRIFQPPELGRVVWAIASVFSTYLIVPEEIRHSNNHVALLTSKALQAAGNNLSLFSTEDLVRIAWSFLEVRKSNIRGLASDDVKALGQILATTEMSLQRWERGECGSDAPSPGSHSDGSVFSSFFGRPRLNLPILELVMGGDDEDDSDDFLAPLLKRSKRPKLKDLSIDPSTLCKASCGFQRLSAIHPHIKGGWTMTRVAVRLLSSKNGRLMRECSIHDLVRLCEATVLGDVDGHGRELIIGLFARQLVAVLNETLDDKKQTDFFIDTATSPEIAIFIWSLGELGVKALRPGEQSHMANRKMRLVTFEPFLSALNVKELDLNSIHRLIRGLVLTKLEPDDRSLLLKMLKRVEDLLSEVETGKELCDIAESVGLLKDSFSDPKKAQPKEFQHDEDVAPNPPSVEDIPIEEIAKDEGSQSIQDTVPTAIDGVLNSIGNVAKEMAPRLSANEIRRILEVYSLLPFQVDDLIDALAEEVSNRLSSVEQLEGNQTLGSLLGDAQEKASIVESTLYGETDKTFLDSIKSGFMSLFGSNNEEQKEEEVAAESKDMTEQIAAMIQASVAATSDAADRVVSEESVLLTNIDGVLNSLREEISFELGQCIELIENYRRIEFSTGKRRSRYDRDRRNDIAKRVLSRLFP
jgi:hypothetical protein